MPISPTPAPKMGFLPGDSIVNEFGCFVEDHPCCGCFENQLFDLILMSRVCDQERTSVSTGRGQLSNCGQWPGGQVLLYHNSPFSNSLGWVTPRRHMRFPANDRGRIFHLESTALGSIPLGFGSGLLSGRIFEQALG
jgi:hypothetical protein